MDKLTMYYSRTKFGYIPISNYISIYNEPFLALAYNRLISVICLKEMCKK